MCRDVRQALELAAKRAGPISAAYKEEARRLIESNVLKRAIIMRNDSGESSFILTLIEEA